MEPTLAAGRPTGMGRVLRGGSAVTAVMTAALLVGCGSEVSSAHDVPKLAASDSGAPSATQWPEPERGPVLREPGPRQLRCLHSTTLPLKGQPSPSLPDPSPQVEPHFWFPLYVECPPAVGLLEEPPEVDQEPGIQPLEDHTGR